MAGAGGGNRAHPMYRHCVTSTPEAAASPSDTPDSDSGRPADFDIGAFSETPPWEVVPSELKWRHGIDELRLASAAEVPQLLRRRRVPPIRRLVLVTTLLAQALGGWYLFDRWRARWANRPEISQSGLSHRLRKAFERLGPTYVKLGQILSSGQGIFPEPLVDEFKLLRDHVPAETYETVRAIVEEEL
ncbi:MAG: ubiquinone biosynthesis protein, partial [Acidimicrobiaceae bacterium]|nr:ubiquinone biosynthesis protein [Acidimicrobiaceae bacterium]